MSSSYDNNCFILIEDASGNSIFIDSKKIFNEYLNQVLTLPKLDMSKLLIYCGYINNLK